MLRKRLGDDQDARERAKCGGCLRIGVSIVSEAAIELTQPRYCDHTVSLRKSRKRGVELRGDAEVRSRVAKLYDLAADRQRREQSRALQRLGLVRQGREPAEHAAVCTEN